MTDNPFNFNASTGELHLTNEDGTQSFYQACGNWQSIARAVAARIQPSIGNQLASFQNYDDGNLTLMQVVHFNEPFVISCSTFTIHGNLCILNVIDTNTISHGMESRLPQLMIMEFQKQEALTLK